MKRISMLIITSFLVITFLCVSQVDAAIGIQWSFEEGEFINYRLISDGLVDDEIISFRIDSPLPDLCELPPDTYNLGALNNWMEIPLVPVTAFIPFGGSTDEASGFENIFTYGGLSAGYWCRFAVPTGNSNDTYAPLVERWVNGPHGAIEPKIMQPLHLQQYLYWGFKYGFEFSGSIYNLTAWYYYGDNYLANVTIVAHDSTTQALTHYMSLFTDYSAPIVTSPEDMNFTVGTTGQEILWNTHDVEYPYFYDIYRNGSLTESGSFVLDPDIGSVSGHVHFNLDDLEVGVWNFTIVVTDSLFNSVSDTVIVTVRNSSLLGTDVLLVIGGVGVVIVVGAAVAMRRK